MHQTQHHSVHTGTAQPSEAADSAATPQRQQLGKAFEPSSEEATYAWWERQGYFRPERCPDGEPYTMSMPPANVTGRLHMGHAMFVTLQDIIARYQRMRGRAVLWLPGTDHAGIATQMVVERALAEEGCSRVELGRAAFEARVWQWKELYGSGITEQLRRLGASCDWHREAFTLDANLSRAGLPMSFERTDTCFWHLYYTVPVVIARAQNVLTVAECRVERWQCVICRLAPLRSFERMPADAVNVAFKRLHEAGLVYRGSYMVNWAPQLQTAVSDLEVEYSDENGHLYFFKYPLAGDPSKYLPIATTRPETILGDTAVAVHPEDPRFSEFLGREVEVPMGGGRVVLVIADEYVDREFGTGALKITPAHDMNDYAIGKRCDLEFRVIMNPDGTMNEAAGAYAGLDRFECRKKLWADLEAAGLALKTEPYTNRCA